MIDKREILATATRASLLPHVVEKDYVLGWMLAGIYGHPELADRWLFKGGTCLKKCFFETYRFSEDLDFTLSDAAHLDATFLTRVFGEVGAWIYAETGIEIPPEKIEFEIFENPRGNLTCQGKISYRGPISPPHALPRIKLDLTADEHVVLPPVRSRIFHPYTDVSAGGIVVLSYHYVEAFAEKFRALAERTRPRDLYDVVHLYRHEEARPDPNQFRTVLTQKCAFKGISLPTLSDLQPHRAELEAGWKNMLAHQLPALLPVEAFWDELPTIFGWLHGTPAVVLQPASGVLAAGPLVRERVISPGLGVSGQSHVELIRFAGANRLVVDLDYVDKEGRLSTREIEPYSLRRSQAGDVRLMAVQTRDGEPRAFLINGIRGARITQKSFIPRYPIELTPSGFQSIVEAPRSFPAPSKASASLFAARPALRHATRPRALKFTFGGSGAPTYVFRCPMCGKEFSRKAKDGTLNPHKNKSGWDCLGRSGAFVRTKH